MGHAEIAKILIESGANARLRNLQNGTTPSMWHLRTDMEVVRVLQHRKGRSERDRCEHEPPSVRGVRRTCRSMAQPRKAKSFGWYGFGILKNTERRSM